MEQNNDFYPLTWENYGKLIEDLWLDLQTKLTHSPYKIDAVIGIIREGMFTALPLAYKLNIYRVLSVQFKYMLNEGSNELTFVAGLQKPEYELPENPIFLLCDVAPCGGKTKILAIEKIKETYPTAKFIFASMLQDKTTDTNPDILFSAYALDINEKWETTNPLFVNLGIAKNALNCYFPWENMKEEMAAVNETEWKYN